MPPVKTAVPPQAAAIYDAYRGWLAARGVGNKTFDSGARCFLARFPGPQAWADLPLAARLAGTRPQLQPLLNFLMLHGHLRPGYDYLLERKLTVILREAAASPLGPDLKRFLAGAEALGYSVRPRTGMASEVAIRMLIQTGRALGELTDADFDGFGQAVTEREARLGRALKHYHHALYASRAVIYHLGAPAEPVPKRSTLGRWSWERHLDGVSVQVRRPMTAYLERLQGTHARSSVQGTASELAHFGRFLARHDPGLASLALLDRQRHIEPYLNQVAVAVNHRTGAPIAASTAKQRIQSVGGFLDAIAEWGWPEAPARRLIFPRDAPKLPHPLPRYLPPDAERALLAALEDSPNRLYADALLLLRATGMRIVPGPAARGVLVVRAAHGEEDGHRVLARQPLPGRRVPGPARGRAGLRPVRPDRHPGAAQGQARRQRRPVRHRPAPARQDPHRRRPAARRARAHRDRLPADPGPGPRRRAAGADQLRRPHRPRRDDSAGTDGGAAGQEELPWMTSGRSLTLDKLTSDDTVTLARTAAEAIRGLNWATRHQAGLDQPAVAYDVLGALSLAASRLGAGCSPRSPATSTGR